MRKTFKKKQKGVNPLFAFILNPRVIISGLIALFGITLYFKFFKKKQENNEVGNKPPEEVQRELDKITLRKDVQTAGYDLSRYIGYIYPWYDPRRYTEEDDLIRKVLKYQVRNFKLLEKIYFFYTKRNLRSDVLQKLDIPMLQDVRNHYKKYGIIL